MGSSGMSRMVGKLDVCYFKLTVLKNKLVTNLVQPEVRERKLEETLRVERRTTTFERFTLAPLLRRSRFVSFVFLYIDVA